MWVGRKRFVENSCVVSYEKKRMVLDLFELEVHWFQCTVRFAEVITLCEKFKIFNI